LIGHGVVMEGNRKMTDCLQTFGTVYRWYMTEYYSCQLNNILELNISLNTTFQHEFRNKDLTLSTVKGVGVKNSLKLFTVKAYVQ